MTEQPPVPPGDPGAPHAQNPAAIDLTRLNQRDETVADPQPPFDPLRLCVFTTVAVIACITGPLAVITFALIAIGGYAKARRAGLLRSRCKLGDTRVVLAYLAVIAILAALAIPFWVKLWIGVWGSLHVSNAARPIQLGAADRYPLVLRGARAGSGRSDFSAREAPA